MTEPRPYRSHGGPPSQYPPAGPPPYYPQPGPPPPGMAPRRRSGRGWLVAGGILALVLVLGLGCVSVFLLTDGDAKPTATATATAAKNSSKQYGPPPDPCTLLDDSMVEGWAGKLKSSKPEKSTYPDDLGGDVDGCRYELQVGVTTSLQLFVSADGHAKEKYDRTVDTYQGGSLVVRSIPGLGAAATGYTEYGSKDKSLIYAGLTTYDNNLHLEIRFVGGGSKPWSADEVERNLVGVARAVTAKVPVS